MAPGAFSLLAPFLRRKVKKYERLETEDPERKRQEATMDELNRINAKIEKLVNSMSQEDFEPPSGPEDQCIGCKKNRAVMQVNPCSHQVLCRLCFVKNIQEAVASRSLPLCCVLCSCKILRVKNNYKNQCGSSDQSNLPKSVSGYEVNRLRHSDSSYSVTSVSSYGSNQSIRSTTSLKSAASGNSWFSIDSLSSFQCMSFDRNLPTQPRPHSITTRGRNRRSSNSGPSGGVSEPARRPGIPNSVSTPALNNRQPHNPAKESPTSPPVASSSLSVPENLSQYLQSNPLPLPPLHHKLTARRGGKENQTLRLKLKSPELAETSFTMSTIEEEIEGVNLSQTSQELLAV